MIAKLLSFQHTCIERGAKKILQATGSNYEMKAQISK